MKKLQGKVIAKKTPKTLIVTVERQRIHPLYKKIMRRSKRYKVHSEQDAIVVGDVVTIVPTRPRSRDKYFIVEGEKK